MRIYHYGLVCSFCFENGIPMKGIDRIRFSGDAKERTGVYFCTAGQVHGTPVLDVAYSVEECDQQQSCNGPSSSAEGIASGTNLTIGQAEDPWHEEGEDQHSQHQRFDDEDDVP